MNGLNREALEFIEKAIRRRDKFIRLIHCKIMTSLIVQRFSNYLT